MERKTVGKKRDWRGEKSAAGFYRIEYEPPMSVREIWEFGPSSFVARIVLFALGFGLLGVLCSFFAAEIFSVMRKLDFLFFFLGILILGGSFLLGKKVGRPFAIMLKWLGLPILFLGIFGIVFVRFGFAAFLVGPVDMYLGKTSQQMIADGIGNGAFRGILQMLMDWKMFFLKGEEDVSILTMLIRIYRELGATMSYYAVIPILVLISLCVFIGTLLLVMLSGWVTILIPVAACCGVSRLLYMLDERF
ncbi:MAG: hypothetical protein ACOX6P_09165 [Candidatus Merdivicinus sp.]|jgi:hypothetical protein